MIDHEGQSSLESIMNWMPRSLDSDCCFIADAPGRINDCHGSACDDVLVRVATSRIRLDPDTE
jgi:hypothetical protein